MGTGSDIAGDRVALALTRSASQHQLALNAGIAGGTGPYNVAIPIGVNRAEVLLVANVGAATVAIQRRVRPPQTPSTDMVATVATVVFAAAGSAGQVVEIPPDGGSLTLALSGLGVGASVDGVVSFWRQGG